MWPVKQRLAMAQGDGLSIDESTGSREMVKKLEPREMRRAIRRI